ncbi:FAD-dependent oxidoreductase [Flavobacterium psychrophilum]|uniref:FAD-dependent oxidoreductase n=1 Tax=Flavobacterium psychrophilum TaxID=96345 RepID=UPI000B7C0984|nr:NAD(P)/FAD-dependent oxidoreductase [Flavobacterium psychrophilum]SNA84550.1 putative monooxygenase [Flavobacterium psychrophilum]
MERSCCCDLGFFRATKNQKIKEKVKKEENLATNWSICTECQGRGKKRKRITKKAQLSYQLAFNQFEKIKNEQSPPVSPKGHLFSCLNCNGSGLVSSLNPPTANTENYPHIAIIGAGIAGVALAIACLHRSIPFTLYERDTSFDVRSQGYGLTLQQASKAIEGLGIFSLKEAVVSTKHVVHTTEGKVIGEWGMRKWMRSETKKPSKRTNMHIARQSLRLALLEQLGKHDVVQWGHQLVGFKESDINQSINLTFQVNGQLMSTKADLLVGADGIRSSVRKLLIDEDVLPLRYLGCIVILGICSLEALKEIDSSLLDSATVFQTANGNERIYMMPYSSKSVMWQLSFPMLEAEAKVLSAQGAQALKEEACRRTQWHDPIPQILLATLEAHISGYPVYDRELLEPKFMNKWGKATLIGDAAHPMSPFKGQGANQALLDALALARGVSMGCKPLSQWQKLGIRKSVLTEFELEMLQRSASKVKDSANAAKFLHSEIVLQEGNEPRGSHLKKKMT